MAPKKTVLKKPAAGKSSKPEPEPEEEELEDEGEDEEEEDEDGDAEDQEEDEEEEAAPPSKSPPNSITRRTSMSATSTGEQAGRGSPQGTGRGITASTGTSAASPSSKKTSALSPPKRKYDEAPAAAGVIVLARKALEITYTIEGDAGNDLVEGLVRLRRQALLCDAAVVAGGGARIGVHRVVMAAASGTLDERLRLNSELDLGTASHEAADLLVRWIYGEVSSANYRPATVQVNEEVLQLASDFCLPKLSELGASRLATGVTVSNVVGRIRLCEEFGLPSLRSALVAALIEDKQALMAVSQDPITLGHPALMRELLSAIATRATEADEHGKRARHA